MKLNTLSLALLSSVILTACDPIEGVIELKRDLVYTTEKGSNCWGGEAQDWSCFEPDTKTVKAGRHSLKIEQSNRTQLSIQIKEGRNRHDIKLDTKKKKIPDNGRFELLASESGQAFDVVADLKTTVTDGPLQHINFRCEQRRSHGERCYLVPNQVKDESIITKRCVERIDIYVGDQDQEYFHRTTTTVLNGALNSSGAEIAVLNGSRSNTDKITTYDSGCKNLAYQSFVEQSRVLTEKKK